MKAGVELVNETGVTLTEILESIKKVAGFVADIATASAEQSSGIDQINVALTQMDEVTQQNSALVEQNAAAAKALEQQARLMGERVRFFELGRDADNAALPAAVAERPVAKSVTQLHPVVEGKGPPVTAHRPAVQAAAGHGSPRRTQRAVAAAVNGHADWKDF